MRRWLHVAVLRHHVVRYLVLGNPAGEVSGKTFTCSCGSWWVETYWRKK